jgi:small Trp-rich protein
LTAQVQKPEKLINIKELPMYLLGIGLVLIVLKVMEIGPVAAWEWWWILSPLALAVVWWVWADNTGYTKAKAMEKMDKKTKDRREAARERLGLGIDGKKKKR